ncbi:ABC transporter ATP-binding protein [Syntrophotalea acetylenivorans]|uniref:ABC transporter ATP-binding protein n=1 Tax=Syntrophotalea acetylenivorans TaxID=1842532 RepID=A0A1L3GKQ1_9BACT|nr:ABC-F family ATP-binding cassette domain-containing protein [Syntrophotalea acetylenivorans]APG26480.1 ABC transporter ATP-binding protein [Syntrophotalea acetylenivorans]
MLQLRDITKNFADRRLFAGINWHIRPGDRIGLCGENGAGKTTLLRLLAGQVQADDGTLQMARGTTFGYLPQQGLEHHGHTLFDEVRSALGELTAMEQEMRALEQELAGGCNDDRMERYAHLEEAFRQRGGYTLDTEIAKVLDGLGFSSDDRDRPCEHFSGGWQMRIALAKLLLQRPNLLLLDEPTNHLDLPARDWLEDYLANYPYAVVLVSHDRFFLDRVVSRIVEVWNGELTEYPGNYSRYLEERDRRVAALREAKQRQDEEIGRIEAFISRFRYQANKASLVQSRIKQLERFERIVVPPLRKRIAFQFPSPPRSGRAVLELKGVEHGYDALQVLADVELTVERGERIALVGANGAGKSTLMRLLAGVEEPRQGTCTQGHQVLQAYFAQDQARILDGSKTVLEEITGAAPFDMVPRVRDILGSFLFSGDDVHKPVSVLSGGERNRLALALLLLRPANLLLLDEPTNHLDLQSKEVLLTSLRNFPGTLVFVSHDRYFVDALATRVLEVAEGGVVSHLGNYEDFLRAKAAAGDASHSSLRVEQAAAETIVAETPTAGDEQLSYAERKELKRKERRRQKDLAEIEQRIETLEQELAELEETMADSTLYQDADRWREVSDRHAHLKDEVEGSYRQWEELQLAESA